MAIDFPTPFYRCLKKMPAIKFSQFWKFGGIIVDAIAKCFTSHHVIKRVEAFYPRLGIIVLDDFHETPRIGEKKKFDPRRHEFLFLWGHQPAAPASPKIVD